MNNSAPSRDAVAENAELESHEPWLFTGVSAQFVGQSTGIQQWSTDVLMSFHTLQASPNNAGLPTGVLGQKLGHDETERRDFRA